MKQFSLEEYLKDPSRKVVTRDGRPVRIVCTDRKGGGDHPIVALYPASQKYLGEIVCTFCANGEFTNGTESDYDLFFAPEKHEGWALLIKQISSGQIALGEAIYGTKEEAQRVYETRPDCYSAIVKLEWEE